MKYQFKRNKGQIVLQKFRNQFLNIPNGNFLTLKKKQLSSIKVQNISHEGNVMFFQLEKEIDKHLTLPFHFSSPILWTFASIVRLPYPVEEHRI